jgi:hypothetical protein
MPLASRQQRAAQVRHVLRVGGLAVVQTKQDRRLKVIVPAIRSDANRTPSETRRGAYPTRVTAHSGEFLHEIFYRMAPVSPNICLRNNGIGGPP